MNFEKIYSNFKDAYYTTNDLNPIDFSTDKKVSKYVKEDYIEEYNDVPYKVYVFWFGGPKDPIPIMSNNRKAALNSMKKNLGVDIIVITKENLSQYITTPLHPAFKYLSGNHKSDYLRIYFLHHFGGGYSDIKFYNKSWRKAFNIINSTSRSHLYMIGTSLYGQNWVAHPKGMEWLKQYWRRLLSNGYFIMRKDTPLTREWFSKVNEILNNKLKLLRVFPSPSNRCCKPEEGQDKNYPIEWNELCGRILQPLQFKYIKNILNALPRPSNSNYQNNSGGWHNKYL